MTNLGATEVETFSDREYPIGGAAAKKKNKSARPDATIAQRKTKALFLQPQNDSMNTILAKSVRSCSPDFYQHFRIKQRHDTTGFSLRTLCGSASWRELFCLFGKDFALKRLRQVFRQAENGGRFAAAFGSKTIAPTDKSCQRMFSVAFVASGSAESPGCHSGLITITDSRI